MNNEINIDLKEEKSVTSANVSTPLIEVSVKNDCDEAVPINVLTDKNGEDSQDVFFNFRCRSYLKYIANSILNFSTFLFVLAFISFMSVFCSTDSEAVVKICFMVFSLVSLILSVIVKLKSNSRNWIKLPLIDSIKTSFKSKEINKINLKILMDALEL